MRIALVAPLVTTIAQPFVGGSQAVVAALAQGMVQRKHEVTLFARAGSSVPDVEIVQIATPDTVVPAKFSAQDGAYPADAGFFAQANLFLDLFLDVRQRAHEFDLVHAHAFDWPSFVCSTFIADIPILHTIHLPAVTPEINAGLHVLHQRQHPLTLITVSQACARGYVPYTSFDHIVYNGSDLDAIPFVAQVPEDAPLLYAGRITPEKGVEEAIEIAERAGCPLLIAGGIYDRAYYSERILPRLQSAGDRVTYLGQLRHDALWKLMGQVRGLLFPIQWDEPFGLTPVEAMAAGTPVIAFKRGAAEEVIRHGETGFLVEPDDCVQAAILVDKLGTLSRAFCRAHVEAQFSLPHMLDEYEQVYRSVIRRNEAKRI
jgi:glycosyltransferase involved in cell wall biosynthesis